MAQQTYEFKGLDLRSNQLKRAGNTARDCSNVRLDSTNRLIKREEFAALELPVSVSTTTSDWDDKLPLNSEIVDFVEFDGAFYIMVKVPPTSTLTIDFSNCLYKYVVATDTLTALTPNVQDLRLGEAYLGKACYNSRSFDGKITSFEKNNCLYFMSSSNSSVYSDTSGTPIMYKWDKDNWYGAGTAVLSTNFTASDEGILTPPDYYVRVVPFYIDFQANTTFGQWQVFKETAAGTISVSATVGGDDYNDYISFPEFRLFGAQSISNTNLTLNGLLIRCVAGQTMLFYEPSIFNLFRITVGSVTLTTVTISKVELFFEVTNTWVDITSNTFSYALPDGFVFSGQLAAAYYSVDYSAGYVFGSIAGVSKVSPASIVFDPLSPDTVPPVTPLSINFSDFYGSEIKGNPPPGVQVREYGDSAIIIDRNNLYFSDLSLNGTVENFTAFDNFPVGEEEKGDVKSFFSNETFIAVHRERDSYLVSGDIFTGNYRIQSYRSTGIGGTSPASVIEVEGQGLFMSNKGPNVTLENSSMLPMGDRIEPLMIDDVLSLLPDLTSADSALDEVRELIYMFVESGNGVSDDLVLVYDYRNKEWFKYSGMSMRGGLLVSKSDKKLYYADSSDIYVEQASYTNGVDASWTSNFETLGRASLKKRFKRFHLFLTSLLSGVIGIKTYNNWVTGTVDTNETITPSSTIPMDNKRMNPRLAYSTSFEITSEGTNILQTDGFEYIYDIEQDEVIDDVR